MRIRALPLLCALAAVAPWVRATSVVPPNFSELVEEADAIYHGRVTDVQARRVAAPDGSSLIKTFVTFSVQRTLKGAEQPSVTLEFLGGTLGDETLEVGGVPHFTTGERGILFVQKNGQQFCPLVRLGHGKYRIEHDSAQNRDYVARENRTPLHDVSEVELPLEAGGGAASKASRTDTATALTPDQFEAQIVSHAKKNSRPVLPR